MADEKIVMAIRDYIYLLNAEGFGISKAFLYGSFATGKNTDSSDIDLMLLSNTLDDSDIEKKSQAWILTKQIDLRIEPYLVSLQRFKNDQYSPILEVVRNEGVEIKF